MTENMENTSRIHEDTYQKWKNVIFKTNVVCVGIIFIMEIIMFFVLGQQNLRLQPVGEYLLRFCILPTATNILVLAVGYGLMQAGKTEKWFLNYIPIIQMVLICFFLSIYHNLYSVLFCTFSFPIFLTIIFNDEKMTKRITAFSFACMTLAQFVGPVVSQVDSEYMISTYLVSAAGLVCTSVICNVLLQAQKQKDRRLEAVYRSRTEALEQLKYDQKTGLYGHTSFQTGLRRMVEKGRESGNPAVAVLDIDDFKRVNDTYGHVKGDVVLLELARIMRNTCGDKFTVARFGGEEFAILFQNGTQKEYVEVIETIRKEFERVSYDFCSEPITVSAGLAMWKKEWGVTEFFDRADEALYISKRQGKNRTTVCDEKGMRSVDVYKWIQISQAGKIK